LGGGGTIEPGGKKVSRSLFSELVDLERRIFFSKGGGGGGESLEKKVNVTLVTIQRKKEREGRLLILLEGKEKKGKGKGESEGGPPLPEAEKRKGVPRFISIRSSTRERKKKRRAGLSIEGGIRS